LIDVFLVGRPLFLFVSGVFFWFAKEMENPESRRLSLIGR